jgi:hypothetical protein
MAMIVESTDERSANGEMSDHVLNGAAVLRPSQAAAAAEFWRRPAPRRLRRGSATAEEAWKLLWGKRAARPTFAQLCGARNTPLLWSVDREGLAPACRALVELVDKAAFPSGRGARQKSKGRERIQTVVAEWLSDAEAGVSSSAESDWQLALGCLAAAHLIDAVGGLLPANLGWAVVDFLWSTVQ